MAAGIRSGVMGMKYAVCKKGGMCLFDLLGSEYIDPFIGAPHFFKPHSTHEL
jgi:hypothetical protein